MHPFRHWSDVEIDGFSICILQLNFMFTVIFKWTSNFVLEQFVWIRPPHLYGRWSLWWKRNSSTTPCSLIQFFSLIFSAPFDLPGIFIVKVDSSELISTCTSMEESLITSFSVPPPSCSFPVSPGIIRCTILSTPFSNEYWFSACLSCSTGWTRSATLSEFEYFPRIPERVLDRFSN